MAYIYLTFNPKEKKYYILSYAIDLYSLFTFRH